MPAVRHADLCLSRAKSQPAAMVQLWVRPTARLMRGGWFGFLFVWRFILIWKLLTFFFKESYFLDNLA